MNKTFIFLLLVILTLAFMFKVIFGNSNFESFTSFSSKLDKLGKELDYKPQSNFPNGNLFGNMRYPGKAFLSVAEPTKYLYDNKSDDTNVFFGFPFNI